MKHVTRWIISSAIVTCLLVAIAVLNASASNEATSSPDKVTLSPRLQQVLDAVFPLGPVWRPNPSYDISGAKVLNYVDKVIDVPTSGYQVTNHWVNGKGLVQYGGHFTGDPKIAAANWKGPYDDFLSMKAKTAGIWRIVGAKLSYGHDLVAPSKNTSTVSPDQSIELHHCHFDWCNDETVEADAYQPTSFYWCLAERHLNLLSQRNPNNRPGPGTPQGGGEIKHVAIEITRPEPRGVAGHCLKRDGSQKGVIRISHMFILAQYLHKAKDQFQGPVQIGEHVYGWFAEGTELPRGVINLRPEYTLEQAKELWKALKERWHAMHNLNTWSEDTSTGSVRKPKMKLGYPYNNLRIHAKGNRIIAQSLTGQSASLRIRNMAGELCAHILFSSGLGVIPKSELPPGFYTAELSSSVQQLRTKIVVLP